MDILNLIDIIIPEGRHRQHFEEDKLTELADSIATLGNLHPPVLQAFDDTLVAGERRYRAITQLASQGTGYECNGQYIPAGKIAILRVGELTPMELKELELDENIRRVDLTWQEREQAVADLHQLRIQQSGGAQTLKDTATEILGREPVGSEPTELIRNATIISDHLSDPDVQKAKSSKEAIKIIARKAEQVLREKLAEQFGTSTSSANATLTNIDAIEGMKELPAETIDVILSDPPYGIGAQGFGSQADLAHSYDDSFDTWDKLMRNFALEAHRTTKAQAHGYIFCDIRNFNLLVDIFSPHFAVWRTPLIWDKSNGMLPVPGYGPRRCYEAIMFFNKGNKPTTSTYSDVIRISAEQEKQHAAQKPVDLYTDLLKRSVTPGDTVLDPFSGSGTIFPAARQLSCKAIGFELDPASFTIGLGRIEV